MKSVRQAKIWKNKVGFFKDGEIRTIKIALQKGGKLDEFIEVIAVIKDNLSLHLSVMEDGTLSEDYFSITHLQSGLLAKDLHKTKVQGFEAYSELNEEVKEAWENWYPEGSSTRRSIGLPEYGDVN